MPNMDRVMVILRDKDVPKPEIHHKNIFDIDKYDD